MSEGMAELRDRVTALEQHVSELEKSLENARKERDDALARLTPSWQVAEDAETLENELLAHDLPAEYQNSMMERLSRLAAKAQAYEAAERERARLAAENEKFTSLIMMTGQERYAAVADNAALDMAVIAVYDVAKRNHWDEAADDAPETAVWSAVLHPACADHPGAALLERMKNVERELELVRKGELCPHEMPLQRIAVAVSKQGETLSAHEVADRALERMKRLEDLAHGRIEFGAVTATEPIADQSPVDVPIRSCNRHADCDKADAQAKLDGRQRPSHCHDETCQDCFGS